ncbi:MAG: hypothetical protein ABI145_01765 [Steroidobacteraceae bacterium]
MRSMVWVASSSAAVSPRFNPKVRSYFDVVAHAGSTRIIGESQSVKTSASGEAFDDRGGNFVRSGERPRAGKHFKRQSNPKRAGGDLQRSWTQRSSSGVGRTS